MKERDTNRESLRERVCRGLDIEPDVFPGEGMVEIRGRSSMIVRGCGRILVYKPDEIRLEMGVSEITVWGEKLVCTSYYLGAVGIEGQIKAINFEEVGK
jgi:sporulation protein YqfC